MSSEDIKRMVLQIAVESAKKGPGWSQEGVVLREVGDRIKNEQADRAVNHQLILDAWHDLFAEKELGWGYDLSNPSSPFFHVRSRSQN